MYFHQQSKVKLILSRDISKHIKRGNPWVFADVLSAKPKASSGSYATLSDHKGNIIAHGFYCSKINLSFRVVCISDNRITDKEIESRLKRALANKKHLYTEKNKSLRLLNGEGDELPGVVCDVYDTTAVLKLDGEASEGFWNAEGLAQFLMNQKEIPLTCVYQKRRNSEDEKGKILLGENQNLTELQFLEHSVLFETNIIDAAKTGFFIDQRENRNFIRSFAKDKTLLNLFGYTGGFSVYAGLGGASKVTTVDIASHAIDASKQNWKINQLDPSLHEGICQDAFIFVKEAFQQKKLWDIVITDPPSFAPNAKSVENAKKAYIEIFKDSLKLVKDQGYFAASSCSGHISSDLFLELCQEALSQSHRRGKILLIKGQPEDHPFPLDLPEMRYLKFVFMQVFKD
jgi:23S rRNA (cytosine1962-C5)-methyltransferase